MLVSNYSECSDDNYALTRRDRILHLLDSHVVAQNLLRALIASLVHYTRAIQNLQTTIKRDDLYFFSEARCRSYTASL